MFAAAEKIWPILRTFVLHRVFFQRPGGGVVGGSFCDLSCVAYLLSIVMWWS